MHPFKLYPGPTIPTLPVVAWPWPSEYDLYIIGAVTKNEHFAQRNLLEPSGTFQNLPEPYGTLYVMVFGWFTWFFKVVSWFFMVFGWFD